MYLFVSLLSVVVFCKAYHQVVRKKDPYRNTYFLFWLGIFVWGDALIIAPFWLVISLLSLCFRDIYFFWFATSLFWVVRSIGETMYWMHEQFTTSHHNPPSTLVGSRFVKDDSIWFLYQTLWQCICVLSIILSVYFAHQWLK